MPDNPIEIYPHARPDRRLLPHSARRGQPRRQMGLRYFADIPCEVCDPNNRRRLLFRGRCRDISRTGALIDFPKDGHGQAAGLKVGDKVFVRVHIPPGMMPEGLEDFAEISASVARVTGRDVGVHFEEELNRHFGRRRWREFEWLSLFLLAFTLAAIAWIKSDSVFYFVFDIPIFFYGLCSSAFLVTRFVFGACYRSYPVNPDYTPGVTIVIPCFNEEEWITRTIQCSLDQDYPEDKLEVLLIDDGSRDKSVQRCFEFYEKVKSELGDPDRLKILPQVVNRGKREALAAGARIAKHDFLIFVDSDSLLAPDAVRQLVQPFQNPKIGAVTGRCDVENKWTNYITKMQAARYYIAFRIFKAAESVFDAVTCLSGPLACYRKELVMKYLQPWLDQKFLGRRATFGDDRSLTNFILKEGRTVYQDAAVCYTIVPSKMKQFLRQQMRWKRSWLRESLRAGGFMWRAEPFMALSFYVGLALPVLAPFVVIRALLVVPIVYGAFPYVYLAGILLLGMLVSSTYLLLRRSNLWIYGAVFCLFYLCVLLWQMPPAIFTFWKSEWGTRPTVNDAAAAPGAPRPVAAAVVDSVDSAIAPPAVPTTSPGAILAAARKRGADTTPFWLKDRKQG